MAWVEPFHNSTLSEVRQFRGSSSFQQDPSPATRTLRRFRDGEPARSPGTQRCIACRR